MAQVNIPTGQVAQPNQVIGAIRVISPSLTHYRYLRSTPFKTWMKVSLVTGAAVMLITLILAVPAAYGLARLRFWGNRTIGIAIFLTYLIPPTILFIPFSQLVGAFKIDNTVWSLILTYPARSLWGRFAPGCSWDSSAVFRRRSKSVRCSTARRACRCSGSSSFPSSFRAS